jgi:hypothetical protein
LLFESRIPELSDQGVCQMIFGGARPRSGTDDLRGAQGLGPVLWFVVIA